MEIRFVNSDLQEIEIPDEADLSEHLDILNSPVLFGCRTGICGTCLIEVIDSEKLTPAFASEREMLDLLAPNNSRARLACQLKCSGRLQLRYLGL